MASALHHRNAIVMMVIMEINVNTFIVLDWNILQAQLVSREEIALITMFVTAQLLDIQGKIANFQYVMK